MCISENKVSECLRYVFAEEVTQIPPKILDRISRREDVVVAQTNGALNISFGDWGAIVPMLKDAVAIIVGIITIYGAITKKNNNVDLIIINLSNDDEIKGAIERIGHDKVKRIISYFDEKK